MSASAPGFRCPFRSPMPNIAAGVDVTQRSAVAIVPRPDQVRKLLTHSMSVIELASMVNTAPLLHCLQL